LWRRSKVGLHMSEQERSFFQDWFQKKNQHQSKSLNNVAVVESISEKTPISIGVVH